MTVVYVYADVVMLISVLATVPMLWGTARAYGLRFGFLRATAAAFLSGTVTLAMILLRMEYTLMPVCAAIACFLMIIITFGRMKLRTALCATGMLLAETALLCGICTLINNVLSTGARSFISLGCMIGGVILLVAAIRMRRSAYAVGVEAATVQNYTIALSFKSTTVQLAAVLDTGNLLKEPISQCPVIILNRKLAQKRLNEDVVKPIEASNGVNIRLVPYRSADSNGVMTCIKAAEVRIFERGEWRSAGDAYVGISDNIECDALVGAELLNRAV